MTIDGQFKIDSMKLKLRKQILLVVSLGKVLKKCKIIELMIEDRYCKMNQWKE